MSSCLKAEADESGLVTSEMIEAMSLESKAELLQSLLKMLFKNEDALSHDNLSPEDSYSIHRDTPNCVLATCFVKWL